MKLLKYLATVISTIGNPMAIGLFFGIYLYFHNPDSDGYKGLPMLFSSIVILPILIFTSYKVYVKEFTDYDVSDQRKRNQLYRFVLLVFLLLNVFLISQGYPLKAILISGSIFVHLFISYLLNKRIKVSMHTSFAFLFSFFFFPISKTIAAGLFLFSFLNGWSRLQLGRHKGDEVLAGGLLGLADGILYLILFFSFVI